MEGPQREYLDDRRLSRAARCAWILAHRGDRGRRAGDPRLLPRTASKRSSPRARTDPGIRRWKAGASDRSHSHMGLSPAVGGIRSCAGREAMRYREILKLDRPISKFLFS